MANENTRPSDVLHPDETARLTAAQKLVKSLNLYKELIAIALFFGGGALWVFGYFATKDQLRELRCFARQSITLNRAELAMRTTDEGIVEKSASLEAIDDAAKTRPFTDKERQNKKKLEQQLKSLDAANKKAQADRDKAQAALLDNACSGGDDK